MDPVYRDVYNRYSSYRFDQLKKLRISMNRFYNFRKAILDSVIKNLCCYSGKTLEKFTHLEEPWRKTRGELPVDIHSNRIIPKEMIGKYFLAVKEKFHMLNPGDIEVYSKTMFEQIK